MRINTSQICMDASVEHRDVTGRNTQLQAGGQQPEFELRLPGTAVSRERVEENRQSQQIHAASVVEDSGGEKEYTITAERALERMAQEVTGQRIRIHNVRGLANGPKVLLSEPLSQPGQPASFSLTSHSSSYHYEKISVHSSGSVQLADGRDINFSLDISLERESMVRESIAWRSAGSVLMDPLVFSFDCDLRLLANRHFNFDLNCDGTKEKSFSLPSGSGFLALDVDGDGLITNGAELFGPTTGQGFKELAVHDTDGNGWIDENDPVFAKLRIWKPGSPPGTELVSLAEAGIGAISLSHEQTPFQLRDRRNNLMGQVAASGFFLTEKGEVRPLQEIKLAVEARSFLRRMTAVREFEVQQMARLRLTRRSQQEEQDLLATLFPEKERAIGLASVEARNGRDNPA